MRTGGGTIAADNHNGVGVSGVAGGDGSPDTGAKLMVSVGFGKTATGGFAVEVCVLWV